MDIAKRILNLCNQLDITPNKLADSTGVPRSTLNDIVTGRNGNPGIHTIEKICEGLRVTLSEFFTEEKTLTVLPLEAILEIKSFEEYIRYKYSDKK